MSRSDSLRSMIFIAVAMTMAAGCSSLKLQKPDIWPLNVNDKPEAPSRVVAIWTDTVLYQPNQPPLRGFGGRLIFYCGENNAPCKVDGTLVVYAFDETDREPSNVKPDRKYVFTKDQLPSHYSKSKVGHSYSIWLPWDEAGEIQKEVSLIVRFMPEKGSVIVSDQTKHLLPGKTAEMLASSSNHALTQGASQAMPVQTASAPGALVQPVSYVTPLPPVDAMMQSRTIVADAQLKKLTTTTIDLPPGSSLKKMTINQQFRSGALNYPETPTNATGLINMTRYPETNSASAGVLANQAMANSEAAVLSAGANLPQPAVQSYPQSSRSAPYRLPALGAPIARPIRDRGPWQPGPVTQQSHPVPQPQAAPTNENQALPVNAGLMPN